MISRISVMLSVLLVAVCPVIALPGEDGYVPKSLNELVSQSELVIEGDVQSVYPAVSYPGTSIQITDAIVVIRQILKSDGLGLAVDSKLILTQCCVKASRLGPQGMIEAFTSGQRYVLFLIKTPKERDANLPKRDYVRYDAWGIQHGLFKTSDGKVSSLPSLRNEWGESWSKYDNINKSKLFTEISEDVATSLTAAAWPRR